MDPKANRTAKMKVFAKIVTSWKLIIFTKTSILETRFSILDCD